MSLELNDYGVQEMNQQEMTEVEGGSFWSWIGGVLFVVGSFLFPPAAIAGFIITTVDGLVSYSE